jgi:hypothetical protein
MVFPRYIALLFLTLTIFGLKPSGAQVAISLPPAVEAVAFGLREVHIYWNPSPAATGYTIFRNREQIGTADKTAREFVDRNAGPHKTYFYSVRFDGAAPGGGPLFPTGYMEQTYAPIPDTTDCDVLVVGATTAGVSAAVTASRYGLNVVMIEETRRLGGMPANGLGATDLRRIEDASGFFEEFRHKTAALYGTGNGLQYEPRIAHQAMKELLWAEPNLMVHREVRPVKIIKDGSRITSVIAEEVRTSRRVTFHPKVIVDATECGDVAAWAGAPFRVGREPRSRREPHAGHLFYNRAEDRPLPGSTGKGDRRVQAYAYLMTVKDFGPGADKTIPMPPGYNTEKYKHALPWEKSWALTSGRLPNGKFEVNQHPEGSDLQGVNYNYPTATYAERRRIEKMYRDHALGYLYYIQTVEGKKNIGLSEDDYRDNDNWPPLLYIREARRFEADEVLDETDIDHAREKIRPNAIGIGDYPMDSHAVEPKTNWTTGDLGEGEFYLPQYTPWHQVPYNIMLPKRVDNVFVPTAVSATHVAYGTLRLEPVRMHFGEAAGIAAYICVRYGVTPREVPARQIQAELLKRHPQPQAKTRMDIVRARPELAQPTLLYMFSDIQRTHRKYRAVEWLAARGFYPTPAPAKRAPSAGLAASPFQADAPIRTTEALTLLKKLAQRVTGPDDPQPVLVTTGISETSNGWLTRAGAATLLSKFMGWTAPSGAAHYADIAPGSPEYGPSEALYANWIDSRNWDDKFAFSPEGKLYFHPDQAITNAQFAELLYLAAIHFGPLWEDHPLDKG